MAKHSLKLLFLRKYRTSKKFYRQLSSSSSSSSSSSRRPRFFTTTPVTGTGQDGSNTTSYRNNHRDSFPDPYERSRRRGRTVPRNNSSVDTVDCCLLIYDCISQNKLKTFVFVIVVGLVSTTGLYFHNQSLLQYRVYKGDVFSPKHGIRLKRCALPNLKPFSSEVRPYIVFPSRPNCAYEQRHSFSVIPPFTLRNGSLLMRNIPKEEATGCCYRPFFRNGDNNVWSAKKCHDVSNNALTHIPPEVDYIELLCIDSVRGTDFRDGFALIHRKEMVEDRISSHEALSSGKKQNSMNILIIGLDATSRMNFIRSMPKSNKYLLHNLSAISLNGYTKVAENTLPNVIPLLTGRNLDDFKKECVDEEGHTSANIHLDGCPFMWKTFASNGYRTSFAEDDVDIGIFNMNWAHAFLSPPTDYYLRPFSILMQRHHSFRNGYCYGPHLSFEKILENVRSVAEVFHSEPHFQFVWSTKLSHDDFNKMRWGDESLLQLLEDLHSNNYLNNTALFIVGDHGSRLDRIRSTDQGKLEDRMPVAYIVLPDWFKRKYKRAYSNLRTNADRITSAFDLHKTLYEFMNLDNLQRIENGETNDILSLPTNASLSLVEYRGSTLFRELPQNRTCFAAGVPLHWCICHKKIAQDKDTDIVRDATDFIVTSINTLLQGHRSCATLTLKSIDEVSKWDPTEIIREGCEGVSTTTATSNYSTVTEKEIKSSCNTTDVLVLQIAFTTDPSDAKFETTVIQMGNGKWSVTEDFVRTNSYEGQSYCVEQKLKPYCYCTDDGESVFGGFF